MPEAMHDSHGLAPLHCEVEPRKARISLGALGRVDTRGSSGRGGPRADCRCRKRRRWWSWCGGARGSPRAAGARPALPLLQARARARPASPAAARVPAPGASWSPSAGGEGHAGAPAAGSRGVGQARPLAWLTGGVERARERGEWRCGALGRRRAKGNGLVACAGPRVRGCSRNVSRGAVGLRAGAGWRWRGRWLVHCSVERELVVARAQKVRSVAGADWLEVQGNPRSAFTAASPSAAPPAAAATRERHEMAWHLHAPQQTPLMAPTRPRVIPGHAAMSGSGHAAAPSPVSKSQWEPRKRKNASTACAACKQKRIKCSGSVPCSYCVETGQHCEIDTSLDKRRRPARDAELTELQHARLILELLLTQQQPLAHRDRDALLRVVRSGAPFKHVSAELRKFPLLGRLGRERSSQSDLGSLDASSDYESHSPVAAVTLRNSDPDLNPLRVPAKPWIAFDVSDSLVSDKISRFLTWSHPHAVFLHPLLFVNDMRSGVLDSQFCSTFLVHAVVCLAWALTGGADVLARDQQHFMHEADRLWLQDEGTCSLTNVQGLIALTQINILQGHDRRGRMLLHQAIALYNELFRKPRQAAETSIVWREALQITGSGLFHISCMVSLSILTPVLFPNPPSTTVTPPPGQDHLDLWQPYPLKKKPVTSHLFCVHRQQISLSAIMNQVCDLFFGAERERAQADLIRIMREVYENLKKWLRELPQCLSISDGAPCHVMCLHAEYYWIVLVLFILLERMQRGKSLGTPSPVASSHISVQSVSRMAARKIAELHTECHRMYGPGHTPTVMMQTSSVAMLSLLSDFDDPESKQIFTELCRACFVQALRWPLTRAIFKMVESSAQDLNIALPDECVAIFHHFNSLPWDWQSKDAFRSDYPNLATAYNLGGGTFTVQRLPDLLPRWSTNTLDGSMDIDAEGDAVDSDGMLKCGSAGSAGSAEIHPAFRLDRSEPPVQFNQEHSPHNHRTSARFPDLVLQIHLFPSAAHAPWSNAHLRRTRVPRASAPPPREKKTTRGKKHHRSACCIGMKDGSKAASLPVCSCRSWDAKGLLVPGCFCATCVGTSERGGPAGEGGVAGAGSERGEGEVIRSVPGLAAGTAGGALRAIVHWRFETRCFRIKHLRRVGMVCGALQSRRVRLGLWRFTRICSHMVNQSKK
ncbi:hypothetical protein FH972_021035 [Carpinus fangiana]|uniref:Zn(2)-C6 fungal-type domain-containing protein n=1 Tax=Carpinus fangiana TaxID=176857 RepID=A0A5N6KNJ3_9ROSI|nr:hypothetical protein FH972_021035 [Carpinus fangiana]